MNLFTQMKENENWRRLFVLLSICTILYFIRDIISLILLTFILSYLITRLVGSLNHWTKIPKQILVAIIYGLIVILLYFSATIYIPKLFNQTGIMIESVFNFYQKPNQSNEFLEWVSSNVSLDEIQKQLSSGVKVLFNYISSIGAMGKTFILSFVLSFFFTMEEKWVKKFSELFFTSKIGWFSKDVAYLGDKFINTFGVVIEAQFIIAIVNTVLTVAGLYFMNFPQLLSLALMIFLLSLIPVAGVIISCIPLTLIGYTIGGIKDVIYVLIMIAVIHMIESYFLNPKLMSSKTDLPVFYIFVILMFSEHFFGVWGLIIGIPVFVFLLDLLEVKSIHRKKIPVISKPKE